MRNARKPTPEEAAAIRQAGETPEKWLVRMNDGRYIHLTDRGTEQRAILAIDAGKGEIVAKWHKVMPRNRPK